MILVFGGTTEANNVVDALLNTGRSVTVSVTTNYGASKINSSPHGGEGQGEGELKILTGSLEKKDIIALLRENNYKAVIDATHPFAVSITQNTKQACEKTTTPYFRLERKDTQIITNCLVVKAKNFEEAAKKASEIGKRIFLTTGSNNIEIFVKNIDPNSTIIARVLNQKNSIDKCLQAGIKKKLIIAENGPFSIAQNIEHFLKTNCDVVVSKDSGISGGLHEKIKACAQLNLPFILVKRPKPSEDAFYNIDDIVNQVSQ